MGASGETETAGGRSKKKTVSHIHRHLASSGWGVGWSGQVRSECLTCTFRASCCSERPSWVQVPVHLSGDRKKYGGGEGVRGDRLH